MAALGSPGLNPREAMLDDDLNTPLYEAFDTGPLQLGAGSLQLGAGSLNLGGGSLMSDSGDLGLDIPGDDDGLGL
jgi:hypothetical protein